MKLVMVITMMAWLKQFLMDMEMNVEQEQTEPVVIEDCAGATCSLGSVTCCPSSPVCTNSVADCLYQGARFLEWEKVMHLLPAYEAGGEEDGSLVVRGYDHMHMQPMVECDGLNLLVVVFSGPTNFRERHLIRLTWASKKALATLQGRTKVIFSLGRVNNQTLQHMILEENKRYGDILQGDFLEDYYLLAQKSINVFTWIKEKCQKVSWIVKTDDDTVHQIWEVNSLTRNMGINSPMIACKNKTDPVIRPGHEEIELYKKWAVSYEEYPHEFYPMNCEGQFYLFNTEVVLRLLQAFEKRGKVIFKIDDVFITGILAEEGKVTHMDIGDLIQHDKSRFLYQILEDDMKFVHLSHHEEGRLFLWRKFVEAKFPDSWETIL